MLYLDLDAFEYRKHLPTLRDNHVRVPLNTSHISIDGNGECGPRWAQVVGGLLEGVRTNKTS